MASDTVDENIFVNRLSLPSVRPFLKIPFVRMRHAAAACGNNWLQWERV